MSMPRTSVAVIDDDAGMRKGLARLLTAFGFKPTAYSSAEDFLERYVVGMFACLVLDIHLPGMSGIELRRRLTAMDSKLPVIFITAVDDELVRLAANAVGCAACLRKPFPARALIDAIKMASSPPARPAALSF
jgi:FixJ family two-component response regulator